MVDDYQYDVAFSFNALDEGLATQINHLLRPRLKTFLYSERQKELAGTDGQETFSAVYGRTSRIVVVLYRPEWGQTKWTQVEQNAIRQRAFDNGWDFTTFIPTADNPTMPAWFPKTRLYVGLQRWGVTGAAAAIEARAQEAGSRPREETASERAARFAQEKKFAETQERFLRSREGVAAANASYEEFSTSLSAIAAEMAEAGTQARYQDSDTFRILSGLARCSMVCSFSPYWSNDLEGALLTATFYKGFPRLPGFMPTFDKAIPIQSRRYRFALLVEGTAGWIGLDENDRTFTGVELSNHLAKIYMDAADRVKAN